MNVYIKTVTTKELYDVAYGGLVDSQGKRTESGHFYEERNVVTVNFAVSTEGLCLEGYVELAVDEYKDNFSNLKEYIKEKVVANF